MKEFAEMLLQVKARGSEEKVLRVFKMLGLDEFMDLPKDEPPAPPSDFPPTPPLAVV